jgi:WD40 repeat protein
MKFSRLISTFLYAILVLLFVFSACAPQKPETAVNLLPTLTPVPAMSPTPSPTATVVKISGFQPITPENIQNMELLTELGSGKTYDVALSPDEKTIAVLSQYKLYVYDRETFREKYNKAIASDNPATITFSPNGNQIVYTDNFSVYFLDTDTGEINDAFQPSINYYQIQEISFTPNLDRIIIKGTTEAPYCDGLATNYALYTLEGNKLFDQQVCTSISNQFTKPINEKWTFFIAYSNRGDGFPNEMYIVENETGNILATVYKRQENYTGPVLISQSGNVALFPAEDIITKWVDEYTYNRFAHFPSQCSASDRNIDVFKVLAKDESSALLAFKLGYNMIISELDLISCQFSTEPLNPTLSYQMGKFSPDDRHFVFSNSIKTSLLNLENNTEIYTESLTYLEDNLANYVFNNDGTKLLLWIEENQSASKNAQVDDILIDILNSNSGKWIGELSIPRENTIGITATTNFEIMMVTYQNKFALWNIETEKHITDLPTGEYLFDASRNAIWILEYNGTSIHTLSNFELSTGELIKEYRDLQYERSASMKLVENGTVLKINYQVNRLNYAEMKLDIENNIVISNIKEVKEIIRGKDLISDYSDWTFNKYVNNSHILFENDNSYEAEFSYSDADPIIITGDHKFWNKKTGDYIGQLDSGFSINELFFSPNHYYLAAIGYDGIIRIFGVKE